MKRKRSFRNFFIIFFATVAMILSLTSCGKGSLKLEAFAIDYSTVTTTYIVGEEVDFTGIQATAKYTDESLNKLYTYSELTFEYDEDITATAGEKQVVISFMDPNLNIRQEFILTIKVLSDLASDLTYPVLAIGFDRPASLVSFDASNAAAGTSSYGDASFSGEFAVGNQAYVIGNENEFLFNPDFAILDNQGEIRFLNTLYSNVDISILRSGMNLKLTKTRINDTVFSYSYQGKHIVTVDTYKGVYQFSENSANETVTISVLPDENYYIFDGFRAITLTAKIVNAYNVYEAWQLSVVDNMNSKWDEFKSMHGINGLEVSGIVLHNDIKITSNDVPDSFFLTTEEDVVYTNAFTEEEIIIPSGTKFLIEDSDLYHRRSNTPFLIQGNFFTMDFSGFPLVPSPSVFGPDAGVDYSTDYSNAYAFLFTTTFGPDEERPSQVSLTTVSNLSIIGNASRNNIVDAGDNLVSAGGLIFLVAKHHAELKVNNVIGNSFFCSYHIESGSDIVGSNIKCYDSYLTALIVSGESTSVISDSYVNGSGGPAILSISDMDRKKFPSINISNTVTETSLTGQELWFTQMGINAYMPTFFELSNKLDSYGLGSLTNDKGQINVMGVLSSSGSNATEVINGIDAQGQMFFDANGIDRSSSNSHWSKIYLITKPAIAQVGMAPLFITVNDAKGNATSIWYDGNSFYDLDLKQYTASEGSAIHKAFNNATSVTLTMGGISIVTQFHH